jgi:hypothetical protein
VDVRIALTNREGLADAPAVSPCLVEQLRAYTAVYETFRPDTGGSCRNSCRKVRSRDTALVHSPGVAEECRTPNIGQSHLSTRLADHSEDPSDS